MTDMYLDSVVERGCLVQVAGDFDAGNDRGFQLMDDLTSC
jgi:hypothetical protein